MKRFFLALVSLLLVTSGVVAYRAIDACADWQERYKRFLYSEWVKISPVIYTPAMIDEVIGDRPAGCDRPGRVLSKEDRRRYRREHIGPNEFLEERRATVRQ